VLDTVTRVGFLRSGPAIGRGLARSPYYIRALNGNNGSYTNTDDHCDYCLAEPCACFDGLQPGNAKQPKEVCVAIEAAKEKVAKWRKDVRDEIRRERGLSSRPSIKPRRRKYLRVQINGINGEWTGLDDMQEAKDEYILCDLGMYCNSQHHFHPAIGRPKEGAARRVARKMFACMLSVNSKSCYRHYHKIGEEYQRTNVPAPTIPVTDGMFAPDGTHRSDMVTQAHLRGMVPDSHNPQEQFDKEYAAQAQVNKDYIDYVFANAAARQQRLNSARANYNSAMAGGKEVPEEIASEYKRSLPPRPLQKCQNPADANAIVEEVMQRELAAERARAVLPPGEHKVVIDPTARFGRQDRAPAAADADLRAERDFQEEYDKCIADEMPAQPTPPLRLRHQPPFRRDIPPIVDMWPLLFDPNVVIGLNIPPAPPPPPQPPNPQPLVINIPPLVPVVPGPAPPPPGQPPPFVPGPNPGGNAPLVPLAGFPGLQNPRVAPGIAPPAPVFRVNGFVRSENLYFMCEPRAIAWYTRWKLAIQSILPFSYSNETITASGQAVQEGLRRTRLPRFNFGCTADGALGEGPTLDQRVGDDVRREVMIPKEFSTVTTVDVFTELVAWLNDTSLERVKDLHARKITQDVGTDYLQMQTTLLQAVRTTTYMMPAPRQHMDFQRLSSLVFENTMLYFAQQLLFRAIRDIQIIPTYIKPAFPQKGHRSASTTSAPFASGLSSVT